MAAEVLIIGGGIAGLACALRLQNQGVAVELFEADTVAGGNIRTENMGDFRIERGPHTFMASADDVFTLASEAGLGEQIVVSNPAAHNRFMVRNGHMYKVFSGPLSFLGSRLLSFRGKLKLMGEPFRTRRRGQPDDSARQFFDRRFGPEAARILAGGFISGVYAGDLDQLSARAAFPLFWGFEQESGSMIRGALRLRKQRRAARRQAADPGPERPKGLCSFEQGLGQLSQAIAKLLGPHCHLGHKVLALRRSDKGFEIECDGQRHGAQQVVLAVPPGPAAGLLQELDEEAAAALAGIPMAKLAVVYLGFDQDLSSIPDGFGFLAPRDEGVRTLGVLFPSRLFAGRSPTPGDLLVGFVGGTRDPEAIKLSDDQLSQIVTEDLKLLTGLSARPCRCQVIRHQAAIPQFIQGHAERMDQLHARLQQFPGLHLAGNYLRGVGMKDAVGSGFAAAAAAAAVEGKHQPPRKAKL